MHARTRAQIFLVASILTGSMMPVMLYFAKGMNIFEFFMLTYLITIPVAFTFMRLTGKQDELKVYAKEKKRLAQLIVMGILIYVPIGFSVLYAEHYLTASLATAIFRTSPLLMLLFIPYVLRERLSKSQIVALLLAFSGLYIALTAGNPLSLFANPNLIVIALLALSTLGYSLGLVLAKKYVFNVESGIFVFSVSLFLLFAALFFATGANFSAITLPEILAMLYISVANNVAGFYMNFSSLRVLKTTMVTNLNFISPFLTFIFAGVFLGEAIQPYYIVIALLVAAGLLIQRRDKIGGTYAQENHRHLTIFDITSAFVESEDEKIRNAIKMGGKVLAIKLDSKHRPYVEGAIAAVKKYETHLYTDLHDAISRDEASFISEIMGTSPEEMVLISAGETPRCESELGQIAQGIAAQ